MRLADCDGEISHPQFQFFIDAVREALALLLRSSISASRPAGERLPRAPDKTGDQRSEVEFLCQGGLQRPWLVHRCVSLFGVLPA